MYTSVCKHCKRIFKTPIRTVCCNECRLLEKDSFEDIKKYLSEFPNSNAMQVATALGISVSTILQYIDSGDLWMVKGTFEEVKEEK